MFDIWASLAELQQPCLYRPIGDRLLDGEGLVRREILSSLDRLFCEHLAAGRASFQASASPPSIPAAQRFLNISALQKSIRRGDAEGAIRFAQQGCPLNGEQVFRRLATCAVEDVGIGNLLAVGMALAVMGTKAMRDRGAPDELAAYLAYILAISPKSRLACDLLSIADYDRDLAPLKRRLAQADGLELSQRAKDKSMSLGERMTAAWLLGGTSRFGGTTMPKVARDRRSLMRLMAASRMPLVFYYIADRAAARLGDAMFVSMLITAELTDRQPDMVIVRCPLTDPTTIAGYPGAAFDLHTSEGRAALRRFGTECPLLVPVTPRLSPTMRDVAIRHGVFIAEGGLLGEQVRFAAAERIEQQAHDAELAFAGLTEAHDRADFLAIIYLTYRQGIRIGDGTGRRLYH